MPMALFVDGDRDDQNRSWACVRGAALVRTPNGSLLALAGGGTSCEDGHLGFRVLARQSADEGKSWTPIRALGGADQEVGQSLRTPRACARGPCPFPSPPTTLTYQRAQAATSRRWWMRKVAS